MLRKALIILTSVFLISGIAVWSIVVEQGGEKFLTVAFLDVGQGDAIFIESPTGKQVLVDGGPNSKVLHEVGKLMPWYDRTIDMIVITNPDKDHIAGFINVLKRYEVDYVMEPGTKNETETHKLLQKMIVEDGLEKILARRGQKVDLGAGVSLAVLFPDRDVSALKSNDGSIVMRLVYGETEVLLTGDATSGVEKQILIYDENIQSDVLKVGHHGSKTSTDESFVSAVNPQYAVISSGKGNRYGHPNQEVLSTLGKFDLKILRTDELGTIVMKSDGKVFTYE